MLNFLRSLFSGKSNHPAHIVARRAFCEELERRRLLSDGPVVLASEAYFQTAPNELRFRFSQNVADSLGTNDLVLRNVLTGKIEDADAAVLSYDSNTNTAMFRFTKFENSVFPDGDYLATLSATGITNSNGDDLQGDHDFDFFFWTADANHDRDVNLTDFNIMAAHFGLPATYGEGDFSFDGQVNLMDFNILAGRFGTSLAEPAGPGEISVTAISSNSVRLQWSTAGVSGEDGWRLQVSTDGQNFFFLRNLPPGTSTHEVTLLQDGTRYWFRVRAYGNDQDTAYSPKKAATTVLLGATDLEAVEFGPTTARLTWANQSVTADGIQVFRSDNGGTTWIPAGTAGANETSFDATISSWTANPLFKIRAFRGNPSDPDVESADTLAVPVALATPTVTQPASANPATVTGTTAAMSVLGSTPRGESYLTYTWSVTSAPTDAPPVIFSGNGTNAAKNTTATFYQAGAYALLVTIANGTETITSSVNVTVQQTTASVQVSPGFVALDNGYSQHFSALAFDQFGDELVAQPSFTWSVAGNFGAPLGATGYQAPSTGFGWALMYAHVGTTGVSGSALIVVPSRSKVYGEGTVSTNGVNNLTTIAMGVPNRSQAQQQPPGYHGGSFLLPPSLQPYEVTFSYDLYTWDSYNASMGANSGTGYWDSFSVSVTDQIYPQLTLTDPLNFPFVWGGTLYGDGVLDHTSGTTTRTFVANPDTPRWINFVLDTGTPGSTDDKFPSWGTFQVEASYLTPNLLAVDSDNNGTTNSSDDPIEDDSSKPGVIIALNDDDDDENSVADWQQSGTISAENDLVPMNISAPGGMTSGTLKLRIAQGDNRVRVWSNPQRSGNPLLGLGVASEEKSWNIGSQPSTVWIEGVGAGSAAIGDVRFVLAAAPPTTEPTTTQPITIDVVRATTAKFNIAPEYVNQDNPTATTFAPLQPLSDGTTVIYGGSEASTADDLKLRVEVTPPGLAVASYTWSVSRADAVENAPPAPGANDEYEVGNIWAKPGDLTFGATLRIGSRNFAASRKLEVGVRTDDIIVASWIDPGRVPALAAPGVGLDLLTAFPANPAGTVAQPPPDAIQLGVAGTILAQLAANDASPQRPNDPLGVVPLNPAERTYLMHWMFKRSANDDPALAIPGNDFRNSDDTAVDENEVANFIANTFNYKLFNRLQIKYRKGTNGFKGNPTVLRHSVAIGDTVNPLGSNVLPFYFNGQNGPAMTLNSPFRNASRVSSIVDGSPDVLAIRSFNTLTAVGVANPVWWENIGNRISFRYDGNLINGTVTLPDLMFQPYPTHNVYINGRLSPLAPVGFSFAQAASPLGNFNANPYPFGPGGRGGNAEAPAASGARQPAFTIP